MHQQGPRPTALHSSLPPVLWPVLAMAQCSCVQT
uniref:Uncharacterized protein n=1 Tax=Arundo donax TaxID=35708 RepID=A0A0A8YPP6_ARUDO